MTVREWLGRQSRLTLATWIALVFAVLGSWAIVIEASLRARLDPAGSRAPTRLYARPVILRVGTPVRRDRMERDLRRLGYRPARGDQVRIGEYRLDDWTWVIGRRPFRYGDRLDPGGLAYVAMDYDQRVARVQDTDGRTLAHLALEPEVLGIAQGRSVEDRVPVRLSEVPRHLIDAVLTVEDQRFFDHSGVDPWRIGGAAAANLRAWRVVQGGSTITQQLARTLWLSRHRSPLRKARELAMALTLERRYSKGEILLAYLNEVYLGQDGGLEIRGVGRAAQYYFGKDVSRLDVGESALVAGLIRGPNLYSPFRKSGAAKGRRDLVLDLMRDRGVLAERAHHSARSRPLAVRRRSGATPSGRYFADLVAARVREAHGSGALESGLAVFTTLDPDLQRAADEAVGWGLGRLEKAYPALARTDSPLQAALVALDPVTGELLALVGGRDYRASQFNRAVHSRRQPGSAFKPVVALAALGGTGSEGQEGRGRFTLASLLEDEPLALETSAGLWRPANYDGRFHGQVTLREALERSLNVPFARLGLAVGPTAIVGTAHALGIESPLRSVPSLALGSSEVTLLELTRAFGVLAAYGYRAQLQTTLAVLDRSGAVVSDEPSRGKQVFSPAVSYLVTSALQGVVDRGTGRALRSLGYWGPVAAKSGTTNDHRDAWFVGYTPTLAVGVWVGFDDGRSLGLPGSRAALPIFARFLVAALGSDGEAEFPIPDGVDVVEVNRETGRRAGPGCPGEPEVFLWGTAPEETCSGLWAWERELEQTARRWYREVAPLVEDLERRFGRQR